ncbi:MAG: ATP-binding protein [Anaerolineales bacterium]|nr:ATP-binding protein [Anaerolineales bacterium]
MRSITGKLMLAFFVVSLIAISLLFVFISQSTNKAVRDFYFNQSKESIVRKLVDYYKEKGTWSGISEHSSGIVEGEFPEQNKLPNQPVFFLLDKDDRLILPRMMPPNGMRMMTHEINNGVILEVQGIKIGTLVFIPTNYDWEVRQPQFLARINQLLFIITLGAILLAIILGGFMSRTLTRPIRELTAATKAAAAGDLSHKVAVRSNDELGELAESFNTMNSELDRLITARKQMTADIAHELRTPISIILGNTDGVREGVIPMTTETFDIIAEEAERLEGLVEDLHTLSRAEAGELPMTFVAVSIKELVDSLRLSQTQAAQLKQIDFIVDIPEGLANVKADPDRIIQVLRNIVNNAYHYTPENGRISLSATQKVENTVALRISDSGPGVPEDEWGKIFNRFYRTDTSRQRDGEGAGLGLAIAQSIVERHGGKIRAENGAMGGLSVVIELPLLASNSE